MTKIISLTFFMNLLCLTAFSQSVDSSQFNWKGLFIAGDHSILNFDRARIDIAELVESYGLDKENQVHYSRTQKYLEDGSAIAPTPENLEKGFKSLNIKKKEDACFVHMTSHGSKNKGFYLSGIGTLPPVFMEGFIDKHCGQSPTVILISACYSGQFITESLKGDNRVILTAARHDLPSFGCSTDTKYTYWDGCLLEEFENSGTWSELYTNLKQCIEKKEEHLGARRSYPQAFFGKNVKNLEILKK